MATLARGVFELGPGELLRWRFGCALGSAVEHRLHTAGVGGSNPPARTSLRSPVGELRLAGLVSRSELDFPAKAVRRTLGEGGLGLVKLWVCNFLSHPIAVP